MERAKFGCCCVGLRQRQLKATKRREKKPIQVRGLSFRKRQDKFRIGLGDKAKLRERGLGRERAEWLEGLSYRGWGKGLAGRGESSENVG